MEEKHICKYCGKSFDTGRALGSHYLHCEKNPNVKNIAKKAGLTRTKNAGKHLFTFNCKYCGKEYSLYLTDSEYLNGNYRKCCSTLCSNRLTRQNSNIETTKVNRSNSLKDYYNDKLKTRVCQCCGKEYTSRESSSLKYCSKECSDISKHNKLSTAAIKNKLGGLRAELTHKYYKRGYYYGIWCDSSWELAFLIYCLDHNIEVRRNTESFEYIFDEKIYKFYPDFIVNGKLVEIKGFYTPKNIAKKEQYPNIEFIDKEKIQKYLDYAISNYGENFTELYDSED